MSPGEIPFMKTLSQCINSLHKQGYTENFRVADGMLIGEQDEKYSLNEVRINNFYRFEGTSDPGDNAICYAIETDDGKKGVLVDGYGSSNDDDVSEFIKEVNDITKTKGNS